MDGLEGVVVAEPFIIWKKDDDLLLKISNENNIKFKLTDVGI